MKEMTYREIIDQYHEFVYAPIGTSMLPLIREGKDTVKLIAINRPLKKYDVILYERKEQFILHRIVKVKKDTVDIVGDHQYLIEKDVSKKAIIAIMAGVYRGDKYLSSTAFITKCYIIMTIMMRCLRTCRAKMKRILRKKS